MIYYSGKLKERLKTSITDIPIDLDNLSVLKTNIDYNLWYFLVMICGGDPNIVRTVHACPDRLGQKILL